MEDSQKKGAIVAGVCLTAAIVIFFVFNPIGGGGGGAPTGPMLMKCAECGHTFEIDRKEYAEEMRKIMEEQGGMMDPMMMGRQISIKCPECDKQAAYEAKECPECGETFILNYSNPQDYPDRCPGCGYSEWEDKAKNND